MGEKFQRVEIEMTAEQQADGRREVSRYHYTGTLLVRDETVYISYEEEMEGDRYRTLLTCGDGRFTMSRKGSGRQRMQFVPGERRPAVYETPVGTLPMEVLTEERPRPASPPQRPSFPFRSLPIPLRARHVPVWWQMQDKADRMGNLLCAD